MRGVPPGHPVKDAERQHPVPEVWRTTLATVVGRLACGNFDISSDDGDVADLAPSSVSQIEEYVADYGETLVDLPDAAWETSVCQWMGTSWHVLVDLWTEESGASDLVLHVDVFEKVGGYRFVVQMLYVP